MHPVVYTMVTSTIKIWEKYVKIISLFSSFAKMNEVDNIVPEYAFHDISHRANIFRSRLIEEFQLLDNIVEATSVQAPQYSSKDVQGKPPFHLGFPDFIMSLI
jgi:hypothetical protein